MASSRRDQIPDYVGDMNQALKVLSTFNERNPAAKWREKEQAFLQYLLDVIRQETHLEISWPEALFYVSADRISHAAALALDLVAKEEDGYKSHE